MKRHLLAWLALIPCAAFAQGTNIDVPSFIKNGTLIALGHVEGTLPNSRFVIEQTLLSKEQRKATSIPLSANLSTTGNGRFLPGSFGIILVGDTDSDGVLEYEILPAVRKATLNVDLPIDQALVHSLASVLAITPSQEFVDYSPVRGYVLMEERTPTSLVSLDPIGAEVEHVFHVVTDTLSFFPAEMTRPQLTQVAMGAPTALGRAWATIALLRQKNPEALRLVSGFVNSGPPEVGDLTMTLLYRGIRQVPFSETDPDLAYATVRSLQSSPSKYLRRAAIEFLWPASNDASYQYLRNGLDDSDREVRYAATLGFAGLTRARPAQDNIEAFASRESEDIQFWKNWYSARR